MSVYDRETAIKNESPAPLQSHLFIRGKMGSLSHTHINMLLTQTQSNARITLQVPQTSLRYLCQLSLGT